MLHADITPIERKESVRRSPALPVADIICKTHTSGNRPPSRAASVPKRIPTPVPIIPTHIPRGFQSAYSSAPRDEDVQKHPTAPIRQPPRRTQSSSSSRSLRDEQETLPARRKARTVSLGNEDDVILESPIRENNNSMSCTAAHVRQLPRRTKSCLSSRSLRDSQEIAPTRRKTRTVSFGTVEDVIVEKIAPENKNAIWFSRDEYSSMRHEALHIAQATQKKGSTFKESSSRSSRGLEKFIENESTTHQVARISVLEHGDLTMYALASSRAVLTARQLADMDALEALLFQKESALNNRPSKRY